MDYLLGMHKVLLSYSAMLVVDLVVDLGVDLGHAMATHNSITKSTIQ